MTSPRNMTLGELLALPTLGTTGSKAKAADAICQKAEAFGGRFQDRDGAVWDTCLIDGAWARYPVVLNLFFKQPMAAQAQARRTPQVEVALGAGHLASMRRNQAV